MPLSVPIARREGRTHGCAPTHKSKLFAEKTAEKVLKNHYRYDKIMLPHKSNNTYQSTYINLRVDSVLLAKPLALLLPLISIGIEDLCGNKWGYAFLGV